MERVIGIIKGFISQWKQIFHNKDESNVSDENKQNILKHIYYLVFDELMDKDKVDHVDE